jgi:starch phosphorylase
MDVASRLRDLARNLWWTWQPEVIALFRDLDSDLWRQTNHNPIAFLSRMSQEELEQRALDLALEARVNYAFRRLHEYLHQEQTWGDIHCGTLRVQPVAYFSAEFGLHESFPIYSGGLGILAGDHLKTASDLGIPLVGVGLFYAQGYFNQHLDSVGLQQESYFETDLAQLPVEEVHVDSKPLRVRVETRTGQITLRVWRVPVGRCTMLLLDSDVEDNTTADRGLTGRLYGGDSRLRIRQELILGVGGVRALAAQGMHPGAIHLNEGHSAFAILETARQEMDDDKVDFAEGMRRVRRRTVFTTHTPVAAGHDRFSAELVEDALGPLREALGLPLETFMALGREDPEDRHSPFSMTVLGLGAAGKCNAVSALHGQVSREMWRHLWPALDEDQVPILHVTNGVHVCSWLAPAMCQLFDANLRRDWASSAIAPETWEPVSRIDNGELWETHQVLKSNLIRYVQRQVCLQEGVREKTGRACEWTAKRLEPQVLTIGLARRFATYKRADLVFADEKRLERLVSDPERPIQIIFAGKAHPQDEPGKRLIQRIFRLSRDERFLGRIVFLEDYDINVGRHLIQGVDLWLNLPRRPHEACGTSGMKAIFNGVLNCAVLDGWWAEAYDGLNGFGIGHGGQHADDEEQDRRDAEFFYEVLENEVIPLYYERQKDDVPTGWVERMKCGITDLAWRFCADRMMHDYAQWAYLPAVGAASGPGAHCQSTVRK